MSQLSIINLESLVNPEHIYRKFLRIWKLTEVDKIITAKLPKVTQEGYGPTRLFRCLLLQHLEDLSDRELERYLQENNAGKWFCGFELSERTPDYSLFTRVRKKLGTETLAQIFQDLKSQLQQSGYMNETFNFVDASHLIAKANLWKERDEAIKQKYEKLNNETLPKVAHDKDARIGCKGKDKFWYGYKEHVSVDMQSGMIGKIAITPANITDAQGLRHVCPKGGVTYADKGYCTKKAHKIARANNNELVAIKKNNMKGKNFDEDRWNSHLRMPYERVFAHRNRRVKYCGIAKNQFSAFMRAITFNIKRWIVLARSPVDLATS